jgi:alanine racemase
MDYKSLPTGALHAIVREHIRGHRPTWAEINLANLVHNFKTVKRHVGEKVKVMTMVKADAYGHGSIRVARALEPAGVDWFGVALPEEGVALREAGITAPIMCCGGFWADQETSIIEFNLTPVLYRVEMVAALDEAARQAGVVVDYHLKIDTGMGRLGVPYWELQSFLDQIKRFNHVYLDGLLTHFASIDDPNQDDFTKEQTRRFDSAVRTVATAGFKPNYFHMSNSAGTYTHPEAWGNLVRTGGLIYGLWRDTTSPGEELLDLKPVLSLHSRITHLKEVPIGQHLGYGCTFTTTRPSKIATLPVGYDDGYRRDLSNNAQVMVLSAAGALLADVVGRISMDRIMVDVTDVVGVTLGNEVILLGERDGISITAEDLAARINTISYEITCNISGRVPRIYQQ